MTPDAIKKLADELSELPSIGPRQAIRLAFYISSLGDENIRILSQGVDGLRKIKTCEDCFFLHQNNENLCGICKNPSRRKDIIAIIEKETDLLSIENTKEFNGRYLILGAIPKTGILSELQKLRLQNLKKFIETKLDNKKAEEIIIAFNPTSVGDFHSSVISKELADVAKKISRLGRGLPTGGEIEFADDETLGNALSRRN